MNFGIPKISYFICLRLSDSTNLNLTPLCNLSATIATDDHIWGKAVQDTYGKDMTSYVEMINGQVR